MDYKHFNTALIGGLLVTVGCLSKYGVSAASTIFVTKWGLLCFAWFLTTLPNMNDFMKSVTWMLCALMLVVFGMQFPYMTKSPNIGDDFMSFVYVMIIMLLSLFMYPYLRDKKE